MAIAFQHCTGKVDCFIQLNTWSAYHWVPPVPSQALYLGTCEQYPLVQGIRNWNPNFNDISGPLTPFDKEFQGYRKLIALDLNKFSYATYIQLDTFGIPEDAGFEDYLSRGTFNQANGLSFTLWLKFQYSNFWQAGSDISNELPPGEVYFCCNIPEDGYDPLGTRTEKIRIVTEAEPAYNAYASASTGPGQPGSFITYSRDPTFFQGLPLGF